MTLALTPPPSLSSPRVTMTPARSSAIGRPVDRADTSPAAPPATVESAPPARDVVEEWGIQSFPASDPPSNW